MRAHLHVAPTVFSSRRAVIVIASILILLLGESFSRSAETGAVTDKLRIFFSQRVMLELKDNDARAAVKAWTQMVFNENEIKAEAQTMIGNLDDVIAGFHDGSIDGASLPTDEYFSLTEKVETGLLYFPLHGTDPNEEFLLLTHRDSAITNLAGLRGGKMTVLTHHRMNLAEIWLNVSLAKEAHPTTEMFFGNVRRETKSANVVLPVFFRKADACLISRRGFDLMTELNPQVGARLRVLAVSPKLVPTLLCFNPRANSIYAERARKAIRELHHTVYGQQILTTFQLDRLVEGGPEWLESARALMKEYARWCPPIAKAKEPAMSLSARDNP
ncbi:MAG TPA: PhnD/SsuA/transferrin family substrate-binding protein [Candidatus Acidoferrum sp.]|nr:PhnD/SsuA/transferrin family substrate-binding protein [Candidatus Acidoferrum sp.]